RASKTDSTPAPTPVAEPGSLKEFTLTTQVAALLAAVRQFPPVRPDVVELAAARLAAGDYNTPAAAAASARAILNAQLAQAEAALSAE
ncbi:MAG: hypothetical protein K2V38_06010, partial [Gemmataceae bacterium]|nr:hypothetical protein [Gemmataceae bacterium]